ncbi:DNA recombination protein RmuC [Sphingobium sp. DEHP117]|nr:DNA recombination protein RmuC [Sphingobium sp. DEHP117]MDQ4419570.1 DNA recombination protein RmuC [Sphingobium sp. DEHP117]
MLGWVFGTRPLAELRRREREAADGLVRAEEQRNSALRDIAEEQRRAESARSELLAVRDDRDALRTRLAALEAETQARTESFEAQLRALGEAREQLSAQFSEIGGKLLGEAQRAFLERADQRLSQQHERSEAQLKALLQPIGDSIRQHDTKISEIERSRTEAYGELKGLMDSMRAGQERVQAEAQRLVTSLRAAPKARGRWGEQQLRNVLESSGLSEHADFQTEVSVEGADGRLRPDVIVRIPGGRSLVIDAKVSLNAYQDAFEADGESARAECLARHVAAMRTHVDALGRKDYQAQFADTPDYVIMFVPGEHFLTAALDSEPGLWDYAFAKRVLLATPTNLIAIARTVAAVWRQEKMAQEAKQIGHLGKEIYERLSVAASGLKKMGRSLNSAVADYNRFTSSFESRVLVTGRKLRDLNIETGGREIEELEQIETLARDPVVPEAAADTLTADLQVDASAVPQ